MNFCGNYKNDLVEKLYEAKCNTFLLIIIFQAYRENTKNHFLEKHHENYDKQKCDKKKY